jgi:pumilio RNA-binding family
LLLTNGKAQGHYSLQDVVLASDNLKRFRDVASSQSVEERSPIAVTVNSGASAASEEVDILSMSLDPTGATLVQEMIMKASDLEKRLIVTQLSSAVVIISINTHGCRVVQRALEYGSEELNTLLFKSIPSFKLVDLCMDVNGNHVMQKFVETLPVSALHEIVMVVTDPLSRAPSGAPCTVSKLSLHSYGCRVIQRLLVRCSEEDRSTLMGFIISAFPDLVCDQFGNYVAQHSLEHSSEMEKRSIISTLTLMDVMGLCCNKFASNVVEKAIRANLREKAVLHRLVAVITQNEEVLLSLMKDKYGNYVVKAICDLNQNEFPEVVYVKNVLITHSATIKKYTYGFHLVDKLERSANGNRGRAESSMSQNSGGEKERRKRGGRAGAERAHVI